MLLNGTLVYHNILKKYGIISFRWSVVNPAEDEDGLGDLYMIRPIGKEDIYCPHIWSEGMCRKVTDGKERISVMLEML